MVEDQWGTTRVPNLPVQPSAIRFLSPPEAGPPAGS